MHIIFLNIHVPQNSHFIPIKTEIDITITILIPQNPQQNDPNQYSLQLIKIFSQQEEEDETNASSTTSEKLEFSSSDPSFPSLSSQFPSSEAKNALKGELERKLNLRRRIYSQRFENKSSDKSLINSTSTSIASRSRFPASSLSSLSPSFTSRSNSRYRVNRTKFTPKTKTKLNNSHRSQIKRTRHRTATKKVQRTRIRGRGKKCNFGLILSIGRDMIKAFVKKINPPFKYFINLSLLSNS